MQSANISSIASYNPHTDKFYNSLLSPRVVGSETYYKKGVYKVFDNIKIKSYLSHNKYKRFCLYIDNVCVSGIELDITNTVKRMYTAEPHSGNGYNKQLQTIIRNMIKENIYIFESELSEQGRKATLSINPV